MKLLLIRCLQLTKIKDTDDIICEKYKELIKQQLTNLTYKWLEEDVLTKSTCDNFTYQKTNQYSNWEYDLYTCSVCEKDTCLTKVPLLLYNLFDKNEYYNLGMPGFCYRCLSNM